MKSQVQVWGPALFTVISPGRVLILAEKLDSFQEEFGHQQDSYGASRNSLDTSVSCEVSRKSLGTSRINMNSLERVWEPA